ncbi:MAG: T9SS type A sorting domain-containing protein [Saprospiraceae bacterium]|nr:T9SS type A sorting domain-containing protein [Saprospiraceae bacterium]MBK9729490.1 T9SS type A sorting domain-containing protein [Saprospiraceae bacterium]
MKSTICIIVFICFGIPVLCQTLFSIIPPIKGGDKGQSILFVAAADSNGIAVLGNYPYYENGDSSQYKIQAYFARFDYTGKLLFQKNLIPTTVSPFILYRLPFIKKNDSIYYHYIYSYPKDSLLYSPVIYELNIKNGDIIRAKEIQVPKDSGTGITIFGGFLEHPNRILLINSIQKDKVRYAKILILDSLFNIRDQFDFNVYPFYYFVPKKIFCQINENIELVGYVMNKATDTIYPAFIKFDLTHKIQKLLVKKELLNFSFAGFEHYAIIKNPDLTWVIQIDKNIEKQNGPITDNVIAYIMKFSPEWDTLIWSTRIQAPNPNNMKLFSHYSLVKCMDGSGYIASGDVSQAPRDSTAYGILFKVGPNGDSLWYKKYYALGPDQSSWSVEMHPITPTPFNTYVVPGFVGDRKSQTTKPWLLHFDTDGCIVPGCNITVNNNEILKGRISAFKFYPNPIIGNQLYFLSRITKVDKCKFKLLDVNGQSFANCIFEANENAQYILQIPTTIPNGMYIVEITGKNFIQSEKIEILR